MTGGGWPTYTGGEGDERDGTGVDVVGDVRVRVRRVAAVPTLGAPVRAVPQRAAGGASAPPRTDGAVESRYLELVAADPGECFGITYEGRTVLLKVVSVMEVEPSEGK